ncbi:MAG: hypothetical protein IJJ26_11815, partial [Victivallales bacterium]|nr:hypothetical protein [Victivallales bacterium]
MFKNDSSPISLFSFQDIVTSLTGIMVLIILLLAIELLQTRESVPQPEPSLSKELQHAKIQQEQLQKTLQQLEQQFEQQRNQAHILTTCDPATLPEQIQNTLAALAQENQLHLRLNTQHQILKNQIDTASSQLPNTPQELKKTIDELFQQNQAVTAESHALQKQLQEAQARLERKQKQLEFSFTGKD